MAVAHSRLLSLNIFKFSLGCFFVFVVVIFQTCHNLTDETAAIQRKQKS